MVIQVNENHFKEFNDDETFVCFVCGDEDVVLSRISTPLDTIINGYCRHCKRNHLLVRRLLYNDFYDTH